MRFKQIKDNLVYYALYLIMAFIVVSVSLSFWNRYVTYDTRQVIDQTEAVKSLTHALWKDIIEQADLGVRGFALTRDEQLLLPFTVALERKDSVLQSLKTNLKAQHFEMEEFAQTQRAVEDYITYAQNLVLAFKKEGTAAAMKMFLLSPVRNTKQEYEEFKNKVVEFENKIEAEAYSDYEWSITDNAIIQIILVLLSLPILLSASQRLRKEVDTRNTLLRALDENNRRYLYDDGQQTEINAEAVVAKSITSFKRAFNFVENVSKKQYTEAQQLLSENTRALNEHNLMGTLLQMSEQLKKADLQEQQLSWTSAGLNQFSDLVRGSQHDMVELTEKATSFFTKYLTSQQGSLFVIKENPAEKYLELAGYYAFDKKKWMEKRIEIGSGLIGQVYLEGQPVVLDEVPAGYTYITSGLGESTPTHLLIVPMRFNEKIEAIFELAGFHSYLPHQVNFLEKAGEFLASALQTAKNNEQMQVLLQQAQQQSEMLKAQEEELRQNMEELEATYEASLRQKTGKP